MTRQHRQVAGHGISTPLCFKSFRLPEPHPHADGCAEGVVDHVIRFAPAHLEEILGGFSSNGAQAADEDDVFWLELGEQNGKKVTEGVVEEDVEDETDNWERIVKKQCRKTCNSRLLCGTLECP